MTSVDVIIPTYNVGRYIGVTIQSILKQTILPNRIIIVDDGSIDDTVTIIEKLNHPLIHLIRHETNMGVSKSRNDGINASTADFITFLDGDDLWQPQKIAKQLDRFANPKVDNCGCVYVGHNFLIQDNFPLTVHPKSPKQRGNIHDALLQGNCITGSASSVMFSRACLEQTGLFDETLIFGEDWDYWLRAAKNFNFDFIGETLVSIRLHPNSCQRQYYASKQDRIIQDTLAILKKAQAPKSAYTAVYRQILYASWKNTELPLMQRIYLHHAIKPYLNTHPQLAPVPFYAWIKTYVLAILKTGKTFIRNILK